MQPSVHRPLYGHHLARVKAFGLPCPGKIEPRTAAIASSAAAGAIYVSWASFLFAAHNNLGRMYRLTDGVAAVQVSAVANFTLFSMFLAATATLLWVGTLIASIFPQRDFLRHLSRFNWLTWALTWLIGVLGVISYASSDRWLDFYCGASRDCWNYWLRVKMGITAGLFTTLLIIFWLSVVITSYTHTLHPHVFYEDSDSEDERFARAVQDLDSGAEYSDVDDEAEMSFTEKVHRRPSSVSRSQRRVPSRSRGRRGSFAVVQKSGIETLPDYAEMPTHRYGFADHAEEDFDDLIVSSAPNSRPASRAPSPARKAAFDADTDSEVSHDDAALMNRGELRRGRQQARF
ncbi:hypothetical protein OIO90_002706 [Microbotryomycetes sp. JL221]|nr:hypothetical protein OIO90_002706 [Microbotryomycetes sp. JL221]